jgi:hypothetical protein
LIHIRSLRYKLKRLAKRNQRPLAFVGALIVFTTFIVKDGIRDYVRDDVDSVKTALSVYQIRNDSQLTLSEMAHRNDQLEDWSEQIADGSIKNLFGAKGSFDSEMVNVDDSLSRVYHSLDNLSDFLEKLPPSLELKEKQRVIREKLNLVVTHLAKAQDLVFGNLPSSVEEPGELADRTRRAIFDVGEEILVAGAESWTLEFNSVQYANEIVGRKERNYRRVNVLSYALYSLGWGLGLVGRLYGVPEAAGGE